MMIGLSTRSRGARLAAIATVGALTVTGCGFKGAYSLPLPGGASHGKQVLVTAVFDDVQDLVPDTAVRVNDVAVGDVKSITLGKDLKAHVVLSINAPVAANLPENSNAVIEQTSLLGEKYVAVEPPVSVKPEGHLHTGQPPLKATSTAFDVEQVFGLLANVLNNGDLGDIETINRELTNTLQGREKNIRGALTQITKFVTDLNGQRTEIVRAIDGLHRLSSVLVSQNDNITTALTKLSPGLKVLTDETPQFTSLLTALSRFGRVTRRLVSASETATVANLRNLQPSLAHLAAAGSNLPHALEILVTYPFPHNDGADSPGDFTGLNASVCTSSTPSSCTASSTPSALNSLCSLLVALNLGAVDAACGATKATVGPMHTSKSTGKGSTPGAGSGSGGLGLPIPTPTLPTLPALPIPTVTPTLKILGHPLGLLGQLAQIDNSVVRGSK